MMIGGARRSLQGTDRCGDAFAWWRDGAILTMCLVDGLGHGAEAANAAEAALVIAAAARSQSPPDVIRAADAGIRESRGAAMAFVSVDAQNGTLSYAGVGNVRGGLFCEKVLRFEGAPGIVGTGYRSEAFETVSWADGDLFLLWTDGLEANVKIGQPDLRLKRNPDALAARLIDTLATGRDDAGVVCCCLGRTAPV